MKKSLEKCTQTITKLTQNKITKIYTENPHKWENPPAKASRADRFLAVDLDAAFNTIPSDHPPFSHPHTLLMRYVPCHLAQMNKGK